MKTGFLLLLFVLLPVLSGCRCPKYSSEARMTAPIEIASDEHVEILWADGHQVDGRWMIHGAFKRKQTGSAPLKAHVDVKVFSPDGELLVEQHGTDVYVPRDLPGSGVHFERFKIELTEQPMENARIVLAAHQGQHEENT